MIVVAVRAVAVMAVWVVAVRVVAMVAMRCAATTVAWTHGRLPTLAVVFIESVQLDPGNAG